MPPKNARLLKLEEEKRQQKAEAERLHLLAEERERNLKLIEKESKENALRRPILEESIAMSETLIQKVRDHKKSIKQEEGWQNYLKCDIIPNTAIPSDIRAYLYRFDYEFLEYYDNLLNWWLKCDQNSIMTQDIRIPDARRQTINENRVPTAKFFDQKLRFMMKVYESLEDTLRKKKVSSARLEDLITIQSSFREKAFKFLDFLTFEILMNIDREMNSTTPIIANYAYSSRDFIKYIWSYKDVTLPQNLDKYRHIKILPLQMNVTMSNLLNLETTSIRVLWFKRDFFSNYCPSYLPASFDIKFENFDCVICKEMKIRKYLQGKRLDEMRKAREDYELKKIEEIRIQQEAEEAAKKSSKGKTTTVATIKSKKSVKSKTVEVEPPIVDDSTYVDIEEDYLNYEDEKIEDEREKFSPENLNLDVHDVNMRKFEVLGGIYKIECLERPLQTKEIYQHMFVRLNDRPHVLKYKNFHHIYEEPVLMNVKEERKSLFVQKIFDAKAKVLSNLVKIEIKLSDKIIWWEAPIACRWEVWEESNEFLQLDAELQDYNLNFEKYQERERKKLWKRYETQYLTKIKLKDFKLSSHPENMKLSSLVRHYLSPILPNEYGNYVDRLEIFEKKQKEWRLYKELRREQIDDEELNKSNKEMKNTTYQAVNMLEKFLKIFEMKHFKPRELFPVKSKSKLEIDEDFEAKLAVKKARRELQQIISKKEEYLPEFNDEIPIKDEPLMLSELIERINDVQKSLTPIFKTINRDLQAKESQQQLQETPRRSKKIHIYKDTRNASRIIRRSTKKIKKLKSSRFSGLNEESVSTLQENVTESSTNESKLFLIPHHKGKWVRSDIHEESYDDETKIFTFYAGRYGTFGLAINKYFNFPFKHWKMFPINEKSVEKHLIMRIDGRKVSMEFKVIAGGIEFRILKPGKTPMQESRRPMKIYELKKLLRSLNINLFPEMDADWYIPNITEKHTAMEFHTYKSMALFCLSHHFQNHECNVLANRREIIVKSKHHQKDQSFNDILVTPLRVLSVNNVAIENDSSKLTFEFEPDEQEFCPDLLNYLKSKVDKNEHRMNQKSFMILWHTQVLLMNLRPLSFTE